MGYILKKLHVELYYGKPYRSKAPTDEYNIMMKNPRFPVVYQ